jgi:hypothetical protein
MDGLLPVSGQYRYPWVRCARGNRAQWLHSRLHFVVNQPMRIVVLLLLLLASASAEAYIGPGAGLSVLGSLWAVIVGIGLALFAILSWPIRILWRRLRGKRSTSSKLSEQDPPALDRHERESP